MTRPPGRLLIAALSVLLPAASHALADSLPNARYIEIRRAAHASFLSQLPQLSALIFDFLPQP